MRILAAALLAAVLAPQADPVYDAHEWGVLHFYPGSGVDVLSIPGSTDLPRFVLRARDLRPAECVEACVCKKENCPQDCQHNVDGKPAHCEDLCAGKRCSHMPVPVCKPVINFYAREEVKLKVGVRIESGQVRLWYPTHSEVEKRGDRVVWKDLTLSNRDRPLKDAGESTWWETARETDSATVVSALGDSEKFLFYEGDALKLEPALRIASDGAGVSLETASPLSGVLVVRDGKIRFVEKLDKSGKIEMKEGLLTPAEASERLQKAIRGEGLTEKEAKGIARIWEDPFWKEEGVRAVYLMGRAEADRLLRVEFDPAPRNFRRAILVCVHETQSLAQVLLKRLAAEEWKTREAAGRLLTRLGKPIRAALEKALEETRDPEVRSRLEKILSEINSSSRGPRAIEPYVQKGTCSGECDQMHYSHPDTPEHRMGSMCLRCAGKTDVCAALCGECCRELSVCFGCNRRVEGIHKDGSSCKCGKPIERSSELAFTMLLSRPRWTLRASDEEKLQIVARSGEEWEAMLRRFGLEKESIERPDFDRETAMAVAVPGGVQAQVRCIVEEEGRVRVVLALTYPAVVTREHAVLIFKFKKVAKPVEVC
jgi:hypothetical protein